MRILFLTPQLPYPPRQGTQIRNFHLLRAAATAHQVDLISFARQAESLENARPIADLCDQVKLLPAPRRTPRARLRTLLTSADPDMAHRLPSRGFAATLESMLTTNRYEVVQVEGIEMARYIPLVQAAAPEAALLFDEHNAEYLLQKRAAAVDARHPISWPKALYSAVQWAKLKRYESLVCRAADVVLAVSEADAAALRRLVRASQGVGAGVPAGPPSPMHGPSGGQRRPPLQGWVGAATPTGCPGGLPGGLARIHVVPNGVDTEYYRPIPSPEPSGATLLFTGTMDFRPNVDAVRWFAGSVLPAITARHPEARLYIVGRSPSPSVRELATRHPNVVVTGPVEDVRPYFARSAVFVSPLRMGGGVRLKILEALAMGLPVVSTRLGAEGIDLSEGKEVLLANTAESFAEGVSRLLEDPPLRSRLGAAGRQAAEQRFDWDRVAPRLLEAYRDWETRRHGDGEMGRTNKDRQE